MIAAWTSAVSLLEPAVAWMSENLDVSRLRATTLLGGLIWVLGLLTIFSFSAPDAVMVFGKTVFAWIDFITANVMLPVGGLLIVFLVAWKLPVVFVRSEVGASSPVLIGILVFAMRYVAPVGTLAVFAYQLVG